MEQCDASETAGFDRGGNSGYMGRIPAAGIAADARREGLVFAPLCPVDGAGESP
jgi:hypothetical protein